LMLLDYLQVLKVPGIFCKEAYIYLYHLVLFYVYTALYSGQSDEIVEIPVLINNCSEI